MITVQSIINYARTHIKLAPLTGIGGFANEPALAIANQTKSAIVRKPFCWVWNRASFPSFLTEDNVDEYPLIVGISEIGFLERCYRVREADTGDPQERYHMEVVQSIPRESAIGEPSRIAVERNGDGTDILRLAPIPRGNEHRIFLDYQRKPTKITALSGSAGCFDPIPDDMEPVLQQFFLAYCFRLVDNRQFNLELNRAEMMLQEFMGRDDHPNEGTGMSPDRSLFLG